VPISPYANANSSLPGRYANGNNNTFAGGAFQYGGMNNSAGHGLHPGFKGGLDFGSTDMNAGRSDNGFVMPPLPTNQRRGGMSSISQSSANGFVSAEQSRHNSTNSIATWASQETLMVAPANVGPFNTWVKPEEDVSFNAAAAQPAPITISEEPAEVDFSAYLKEQMGTDHELFGDDDL
jgi:hypothetical protein